MTQEEHLLLKYNEVIAFMEKNKRDSSRYDNSDRGLYCNWIKHHKILIKAEELKPNRAEIIQ